MPAAEATTPAAPVKTKSESQAPPVSKPQESAKAAPSKAAPSGPAAAAGDFAVPEVDTSKLPMGLQTRIGDARYQARRSPDDTEKVGELGALYFVNGFPEAALVCFKRTAALEPNQPAWWYYIGLICERLNDNAQAKAAFEKTITLNNYAPARQHLEALKGGTDKANATPPDSQSARAPDPLLGTVLVRGAHLPALLDAAMLMAQNKRYPEAEKLLRDARDVDVVGLQTRNVTAQVLVLEGKLDEAQREIERARNTPEGKDYPALTANLARILILKKQYEPMVRLLADALERLPDSPSTADMANMLAWGLATCPDAKVRNPPEAVKWAEKACELTKHKSPLLLDTLAASYAAAGRFDDARKWIVEAVKLAKEDGRTADATEFEQRQALYEANKPFVDKERQ